MSSAPALRRKIVERFFRAHPPEEKTLGPSPGSGSPFADLARDLAESRGWRVFEEGKDSGAPTLALLEASLGADQTLREWRESDARPRLLVLHCDDDARKKRLFPAVESLGYRMLRESGPFFFFARARNESRIVSGPHRLDSPETTQRLGSGLRSLRLHSPETQVTFISAPASDLLVPRRFDIALKVLYARLWREGAGRVWREKVYYEQALRITGPAPGLREYDGSGKEGLEAFLNAFHSLIEQEDMSALPPFPVDREGVALDGAHRVAAGLVKGARLFCARVEAPSTMDVSSRFFAGLSHGHAPCPEDILDAGAIEYCRHAPFSAIALIFPSVPDPAPARERLSRLGEIVHEKTLVLSPRAGAALLRQAYLAEPWMETSGHESGFRHKVRSCFPFTGPLRVILFDRFDPAALRPLKDEIRALYGLGHHSIHVTDSAEETLRIARALFNANAVEALRRGAGEADFSRFAALLSSLREWMSLHEIDEERVCVDSGAVLAALGLRECKDLDFLYHGDPESLPPLPEGVACHNSEAKHYAHEIGEIAGDPALHFWYMGVKFCAPEVVRAMKLRRAEPKDLRDAALLRSVLPLPFLRALNRARARIAGLSGGSKARSLILLRRVKGRLRRILKGEH